MGPMPAQRFSPSIRQHISQITGPYIQPPSSYDPAPAGPAQNARHASKGNTPSPTLAPGVQALRAATGSAGTPPDGWAPAPPLQRR